jgi:translation initiation factor IF-2
MSRPVTVIRDIHHYGDDLTVPEAIGRFCDGGQITVTVADPAPPGGIRAATRSTAPASPSGPPSAASRSCRRRSPGTHAPSRRRRHRPVRRGAGPGQPACLLHRPRRRPERPQPRGGHRGRTRPGRRPARPRPRLPRHRRPAGGRRPDGRRPVRHARPGRPGRHLPRGPEPWPTTPASTRPSNASSPRPGKRTSPPPAKPSGPRPGASPATAPPSSRKPAPGAARHEPRTGKGPDNAPLIRETRLSSG